MADVLTFVPQQPLESGSFEPVPPNFWMCERCGELFVRPKHENRPNKGRFCSKACAARSPMSPAARILARCVPVGDCLVFQGPLTPDGYGHVGVEDKTQKVHRVVYEAAYGPIPDGLTIDHVRSRGCLSRACCNIAHLEAVTRAENTLRGDGLSAQNARKRICLNGHELAGANLEPYALARGVRKCIACRNARKRDLRRVRANG